MKIFTKTFGCQMNFADTDELSRHFKSRDVEPTEDPEAAHLIMVNTCTIREMAEHKALSYIGRLKEWKDHQPERAVIVTGCAAERAKADIRRRFPFVDLIVGAKDIERFPEELDRFLNSANNKIPLPPSGGGLGRGVKSTTAKPLTLPSPPRGEGSTSKRPALETTEDHLVPAGLDTDAPTSVIQYVTIMRGCNYNCSYCIVPSVRGREIYRPIKEILKETADRVAEGGKEIWLLGQTVNSYRPASAPKENYDFSDLLRDLARVPGVERIRFMSPHPHYVNSKLISAIAETPAVCEHIHLPVQSGSNPILQKMKRNYTRESYLNAVRDLRRMIPGISITTDLIVGFPGETEEDLQQTLSLVGEAHFDSAYCFKYSPRPGTVSAAWEDSVPEEEKERRVNQLLALTDNQGANKARSLINTVQEVLIEQDKGEGLVRGKTRTAWRTRIKNSGLRLGQTVSVRITGTHSRELHGEMVPNGTVIPAKAGIQAP